MRGVPNRDGGGAARARGAHGCYAPGRDFRGNGRTISLTYWDPFDEPAPREFSARLTRGARAPGVARPAERRLLRRRVAVLALAVAVPAMAAPRVSDEGTAPATLAPAAAPAAALPAFTPMPQTPDTLPAPALAGLGAPGLQPTVAARAFSLGGSFTDRLRAEECLTMAVYYEAASESVDGQRAVAQVVMNRVHHPSYPDNVCGVVFQGSQRSTGCQFSFTCDGSLDRKPQAAAWLRARRVASAALGGFVYAPVGLATHYHRTDIYPYWAPSLTPVGTIGLHRFYRWSGMAGRIAAFSASYGGNEPLPVRYAATPAETATAAVQADTGAPLTQAPVAAPTASPAPVATTPAPEAEGPGLFPQSGDVRQEYARSGRWLRQP